MICWIWGYVFLVLIVVILLGIYCLWCLIRDWQRERRDWNRH